jgi:hypothetical protein
MLNVTSRDSRIRLVWPTPPPVPPPDLRPRRRRPAQPEFVRRHAPELFLVPVPCKAQPSRPDESQANVGFVDDLSTSCNDGLSIVRKADSGRVRLNWATPTSMTAQRQQFTRNGRLRPDISDRSFHLTLLTQSLRQPPPPKFAFLRPGQPFTPPVSTAPPLPQTSAASPLSETMSEPGAQSTRVSATNPPAKATRATGMLTAALDGVVKFAETFGRGLAAQLERARKYFGPHQ